ncbi:MAG: hypothetical protein P8N09_06645 [Planctomycetota bacterium]|nr:hypothetical protein [Planctomycetota bacterium]
MRSRIFLTTLVLLGVARFAAGGGESIVYAMTQKGRVYVNSTLFEILPGKFNLHNVFSPHGPERWTDLAVSGSDRFELRLDGRIEKNGALFRQLPFFVADFSWSNLELDGDAVHALRTDGLLALDSGVTIQYDREIYQFYDTAVLDGRVYVLRGDGTVFVDDQTDPAVKFTGKKNKLDTEEGKGAFGASIWQRLVTDPALGVLVALRGDGQLQSWGPGQPSPFVLESLPFPKKSEKVRPGHRYIDLEIASSGQRYVLRRDGKVYNTTVTDVELVDYPGKTKTARRGEGYVDLALLEGEFMAIRWDGRFYRGLSTDLVVDLEGKRYVRLGTSTSAPDMTNFANSDPVAAVYSAKAVEGLPLSIPLVINDVDRAADELIVVADLSGLPLDATYDEGTRTVNWANPGPKGKYSFQISVDDGFGSSPSFFTYKIDVKPAETGGKVRAPWVSSISPIQVLVGRPYVLPILAVTRDGSRPDVSPKLNKGAFALGATYDEALNALVWTAAFEDVGKTTASFQISNENKSKSLSIKINVVNPLIFGEE